MVEFPPYPSPGNKPGGATVRPLKSAILVDGKLRCPDHPDARVRTVVVGVRYRCQREHNLDAPEADNG